MSASTLLEKDVIRETIVRKVRFDTILVEVTRRCNLKCAHCLRGEAQKLDIDLGYVDTLFQKTEHIRDLTITGGEPSLAVDEINGIVDLIKKHNVKVAHFYIVTNGKRVTKRFLQAVKRLNKVCMSPEYSHIDYSNSPWHKEITPEAKTLLESLPITIRPKASRWDEKNLLVQGRAKKLKATRPSNVYYTDTDEWRINNAVTLTAKGNLYSGCELTFDNGDKYAVCSVNHPDILQAFRDYDATFNYEYDSRVIPA